jgi:hypothetical protein
MEFNLMQLSTLYLKSASTLPLPFDIISPGVYENMSGQFQRERMGSKCDF